MLELVRLGGISLQQGELFGDILVAMTEAQVDEGQFAIYDQR
jgi:chromatin segregation and condensation protein Rec8/ScpA/Scc1 (kleisin family)